jgi:hypothetical protein
MAGFFKELSFEFENGGVEHVACDAMWLILNHRGPPGPNDTRPLLL